MHFSANYRWRATFVAALLACSQAAAADQPLTFEQHVAPILQARCIKCHGGDKIEAGLDLRRKSLIAKGGDSGTALVDGKPDESLLLSRIVAGEMPPKEEGPFDLKQRELIRAWIAAGARVQGATEQPLDEVEPPSRLTDEDRQFWSFQPPVRASLPVLKDGDRLRAPSDAFLLARLESNGLSFAVDAPRDVLLRRLSFAVTGLPPTPAELATFLADHRPDAYERELDRLLASPRFGEHAARHWLDVAGYADSDGYLAADRLRPQAWRYRDYVIQALNSDLPYDQFLLEQIAGDELSDWRRADEITPQMARQLAATGFLRTASDPTYPGYTEPNEIHQVMADTLQIVSTSLLGLTIHCARCHAHKFDPVSQRDYYALQAIFRPAQDPARWQPSETRGIPLASEPQQARIAQRNAEVEARVGQLQKEVLELTTRTQLKRVAERLGPQGGEAELVKQVATALAAAPDKRSEEQKALVAKHAPDVVLNEQALAAFSAEFKEKAAKLKAAIASETALKEQPVLVRGLMDLDDKPAACNLLIRGDHNKLGAVVEPSPPEVLLTGGSKYEPQPGYKTTGRRTALARWLVAPEHPLTSRVQVNRVWARLFGRGIVPTVANFGRSGAKPTHPELLDALAVEFRERGWSQKELYRQLLSSTAWRQASNAAPAAAEIDPTNDLLSHWRARRHTGEMLRDATLAMAGKLNGPLYGTPSPVAAQGDGSVLTADDAAGNRRSIYLQVRRSQHVTMLDLFDVPMMEVNCPERSSSIVPLQALAMLHGPFAEQSAADLAGRILNHAPADDAGRIDFAWRLVYSRAPKPTETQALTDFIDAVVKEKLGETAATADSASRAAAERAAWTQAALVLLNSNEFLYVH